MWNIGKDSSSVSLSAWTVPNNPKSSVLQAHPQEKEGCAGIRASAPSVSGRSGWHTLRYSHRWKDSDHRPRNGQSASGNCWWWRPDRKEWSVNKGPWKKAVWHGSCRIRNIWYAWSWYAVEKHFWQYGNNSHEQTCRQSDRRKGRSADEAGV